jgi:hypothetical protein
MELYEWYGGLSPWVRFGVAFLFLGASTVAWLAGYFWPWGWAVGLVMLVLALPSRAERKGFHDF